MNKVLVGVFSDTHLNNVNNRFISLVNENFAHCNCTIHAGDIVNDDILSVIEMPVYAVRGNMDFSSKFPIKRVITILNKKIGIIHGYGHPDGIQERIKREFENDNLDCIVFGHTHCPQNEVIDGILFFNPGSPFENRWASKKSIGYLEINENSINGIIKEL